MLWITTPALGLVELNVTRVGFPTLQQGDVVRSGSWVPVIVDLALLDEDSFDGHVRIAQFDTDGDECYDRVDVHLRAETGGTQRLYLYVPANLSWGQGRFVVELFDEDGEAVRVVSQGELTFRAHAAQRPSSIEPDDILILSLSTGTVGRIRELATLDQQEVFARPVRVAHVSPAELPELWIGLETVDYIVWDDARPELLTKRQIHALLEWVRQGGTLLIAASRTGGPLRLADSLYETLPVDIGEIKVVQNLPAVRKLLLSTEDDDKNVSRGEPPWWEAPFDAPVPVVECTLREGAFRVPEGRLNQSNVVTRRRVGRGYVIFAAVRLYDLFSGGGSVVTFFRELFHLPVLPQPDGERPRPVSLFPHVVSAVSFARSGSLYLVIAIVFCVVYAFLATFGSWGLLASRGWQHHSWTAFAAVGIGASLLSVLAVGSVRGLGETLHQISIIDADAGKAYGHATAFFGVKTGTDRRLDLWLPSDALGAAEPGATNCFLRPLPAGTDSAAASTSYADPGEYRIVPASAVVEDVRVRATLKGFEGRWSGPLGGTLTGDVTVKGIQILDGSYIVNNLGVDLKDCYLLHTTRDLTKNTGPRSSEIYAYPIGEVPSDGSRINLADRCYPPGAGMTVAGIIKKSTLANAQSRWGAEFSSLLSKFAYGSARDGRLALGQEKNALLLISTVGESDPQAGAGMAQAVFGSVTWSRDRLRGLDLREQLRRDTVTLLGFARAVGPVRLFRRTGDRPYRMLEPDPRRSWTMYRIRIPVTVVEAPREPEVYDEADERMR